MIGRCCVLALSCAALFAQTPLPSSIPMEAGIPPAFWPPSGPKCMEVPDYMVHEYNPNFYIIRQSGCLDFEKPFVYLIFGKQRGLLLDTGSRNFPAALMLEAVAGKWLERNHREHIDILVVHTHPHSDHIAGDAALRNLKSARLGVTVVPPELEPTKRLYGIDRWPEQTGTIDLGDRILDAIPIPGHSALSIALYDRRTGVLFTGDSLYPGRLYVENWNEFIAGIQRLVSFTSNKVVAHIFGNHIEQTRTAFVDYPVGTVYQPEEHILAMSRGDLLTLSAALQGISVPRLVALPDFTIWPNVRDAKAEQEFRQRVAEQNIRKWNQDDK